MRECDLIMKGGITSGVVYPFAITKIAASYRLCGIGGSSAGAIAAALAAAAERRRQISPEKSDMAGFDEIETIAEGLAKDMGSLLQPSPDMKGLYSILLATVEGDGSKWKAVALALLRENKTAVVVGAVLLLLGIVLALVLCSFWFAALAVLVGILTTLGMVAVSLYKSVMRDLPRNDYGMLPGITQPGHSKPGLTDWLADQIDIVSGNLGPDGRPGDPLTVGQLEKAEVELAAMTTDLSSQRPFQLPLRTAHHFFSKAEFEKLFPQRVVRYLIGDATPADATGDGGPDDLYPLRPGGDFPVLLCARLSLSFPMLIRAVPLWRKDYGIETEDGSAGAWRRCVFSDGGISSNLPVHFFDAWLPRRPTFGIALTAWEKARHGEQRVYLSDRPRQNTNLPIRPIKGLGGFLFSIVNAAKDWQDTLQTRLPGFAERIVEIRLDESKEGGMNLSMEEETIDRLQELGRKAGCKLATEFKFDENRWRRALSLLPEVEASLEAFAESYDTAPPGQSDLTYAQLLTAYQPDRYKPEKAWRQEVLSPFAESLAAIGRKVADDRGKAGQTIVQKGKIPSQDAGMRLLAEADRRPQKQSES